MMPTFPRSPLSFRTAGFPSTTGRLAFQAVPSWVISGLSLLPACAVRHPVCIRPSCASWSQRLSRSVSGRGFDCAPPWRSLLLRPRALAQVRVIVFRTVITYSAPSVPLAGTSRFHRMAAYTRCLRCAGAPKRPRRGYSGSQLLRPVRLLAPSTDLTGLPANGGFYFQAFSGSVALPAAGYDYNSVWTPLLAGLSPAGMAASLAALVRP